jgi:hypothetical protein
VPAIAAACPPRSRARQRRTRQPAPARYGGGQHAQVRGAAGPVPVARGGKDPAVLADREGRRADLRDAALPAVIGTGGLQELLDARVIQAHQRDDGAAGMGAELRRDGGGTPPGPGRPGPPGQGSRRRAGGG